MFNLIEKKIYHKVIKNKIIRKIVFCRPKINKKNKKIKINKMKSKIK